MDNQNQNQSNQPQSASEFGPGSGRAKRHSVITTLSRELRGLRTSRVFEVYGHSYTLELLAPKDEDWVAEKSASQGNNVFEFASKQGKPRIACALTAIDGVSVAELFQLPEEPQMSREVSNFLRANPARLGLWLRDEVHAFICNDMDSEVLAQLERCYSQMDAEKTEALRKLGPLSKGTTSSV